MNKPHFVVSLHQLKSCPAYENVSDAAAQTEDTEEQEDLVWSPVRLEPPASNKTGPLQIYSHSSNHNFTQVLCDCLQMQLNQRRDSPDGNKVVPHGNISVESEAVEDVGEVDTFTCRSIMRQYAQICKRPHHLSYTGSKHRLCCDFASFSVSVCLLGFIFSPFLVGVCYSEWHFVDGGLGAPGPVPVRSIQPLT